MIKTNTSQNTATVPSRDAYFEKLYTLIRKRVKYSFVVRKLASVDDVTGDIFLQLIEQELPPLESDEFKKLLSKMVNRFVRRIKRSVREMLDIDELGESEHPIYEVDFSGEENFEFVFDKFCKSFPEPQRTVYFYSRIIPRKDIADLTGLTQRRVAQLAKQMPVHFKTFIDNYLKSVSR